LALTSPTGGGRSVGIVRVRTKATEFSFSSYGFIADCWTLRFNFVINSVQAMYNNRCLCDCCPSLR